MLCGQLDLGQPVNIPFTLCRYTSQPLSEKVYEELHYSSFVTQEHVL